MALSLTRLSLWASILTVCQQWYSTRSHVDHGRRAQLEQTASQMAGWHLGYDHRAPVYDRKQKAQGTIMQTNRLCDSARALRPRAARPPGDTSPRSAAPCRVGTHPSAPRYGCAHHQLSRSLTQHKLRLVPARSHTLKPYKRSAMRPTSGAAHAAMPPALMQRSSSVEEVSGYAAAVCSSASTQ